MEMINEKVLEKMAAIVETRLKEMNVGLEEDAEITIDEDEDGQELYILRMNANDCNIEVRTTNIDSVNNSWSFLMIDEEIGHPVFQNYNRAKSSKDMANIMANYMLRL